MVMRVIISIDPFVFKLNNDSHTSAVEATVIMNSNCLGVIRILCFVSLLLLQQAAGRLVKMESFVWLNTNLRQFLLRVSAL